MSESAVMFDMLDSLIGDEPATGQVAAFYGLAGAIQILIDWSAGAVEQLEALEAGREEDIALAERRGYLFGYENGQRDAIGACFDRY